MAVIHLHAGRPREYQFVGLCQTDKGQRLSLMAYQNNDRVVLCALTDEILKGIVARHPHGLTYASHPSEMAFQQALQAISSKSLPAEFKISCPGQLFYGDLLIAQDMRPSGSGYTGDAILHPDIVAGMKASLPSAAIVSLHAHLNGINILKREVQARGRGRDRRNMGVVLFFPSLGSGKVRR